MNRMIDRRAFVALVLLTLVPGFASAQQVSKNDKRIKTEYTSFQTIQGLVKGYLVQPVNASESAKVPAVIVVQESRGLNPYIEDVARRLATENFLVFAPDAGSPEDFVAAARWLQANPASSGKLGVVGLGGSTVNTLAVRMGADVAAAVSFYGRAPAAADVANIKAAVLVHHAELDQALAGDWPIYNDALSASGITHEAYVYPGVNHGFHVDGTQNYDADAAKLAWSRSVAWLNKYLRAN